MVNHPELSKNRQTAAHIVHACLLSSLLKEKSRIDGSAAHRAFGSWSDSKFWAGENSKIGLYSF
jgi:hypothetical protein